MQFTVNDVKFEMVRVEGGSFEMGSDNLELSQPANTDTIHSFYIGKTEVTQALWQAVMGSNPSHFKDENRPVENVSWDDCLKFISRLNQLTGKTFRLPSEAEWEYAACGGCKSQVHALSGSDDIDSVAWYDENSGGEPHPVAKKQANERGIYDMSGNVAEWIADIVFDDETSAANGSFRVSRGCSWNDSATDFRDADCNCYPPGYRDNSLGLRLALEVVH